MLAMLPAAIGAASVTALLVGVGVVFRYVLKLQADRFTAIRHDNVDDAKDELIETLQSNQNALMERVEILEDKAKTLDKKLADSNATSEELRSKLADTLQRYDELSKYAAPEAVRMFCDLFTNWAEAHDHHVLDGLAALARIEQGLAAKSGQE